MIESLRHLPQSHSVHEFIGVVTSLRVSGRNQRRRTPPSLLDAWLASGNLHFLAENDGHCGFNEVAMRAKLSVRAIYDARD